MPTDKSEDTEPTLKCVLCGVDGAVRYRQHTYYEPEEENWTTLCPECREMNDEHWQELWDMYYDGMRPC